MGTQSGIHTYTGGIGNTRGFKRKGTKKGTNFESQKGGIKKDAFKSLPESSLIKQNCSEFGGAGLQTKVMNAEWNLRYKELAGKLNSALQKFNMKVIKLGVGVRGQRPYNFTLHFAAFIGFLIGRKSFRSGIISAFTSVIAVGRNSVLVTFPTIPAADVKAPRGATHFRISVGIFSKSDAAYDVTAKTYLPTSSNADMALANTVYSAWFPVGVDVVAPTALTAADVLVTMQVEDTAIVIVGCEFSQEVNAVQYPMISQFCASVVDAQ